MPGGGNFPPRTSAVPEPPVPEAPAFFSQRLRLLLKAKCLDKKQQLGDPGRFEWEIALALSQENKQYYLLSFWVRDKIREPQNWRFSFAHSKDLDMKSLRLLTPLQKVRLFVGLVENH